MQASLGQNIKNLENEIVRGDKIKQDLELITQKLENITNDKSFSKDKIGDINNSSLIKNDNSTISLIIDNKIMNNTNNTDSSDNTTNTENSDDPDNSILVSKNVSLASVDTPQESNSRSYNVKSDLKFKKKSINDFNEIRRLNRFSEIETIERNNINKSQTKLDTLYLKQDHLNKNLDLLLFENTDKSRHIYQQLSIIKNYFFNLNKQKIECQSILKNTISENIELKEALAELEIKLRSPKN